MLKEIAMSLGAGPKVEPPPRRPKVSSKLCKVSKTHIGAYNWLAFGGAKVPHKLYAI